MGRAQTSRDRSTDELVAVCSVRRPHERHALRLFRALGPQPPSIIGLRAIFEDNLHNNIHFVFEWMNQNLAQLISSKNGIPLDLAVIIKIGKEILTGLAYIHSSGFAHRNVRPTNILVTETVRGMVVKLADFSQAWPTRLQVKTDKTNIPQYRAPEQLLCTSSSSNHIDIWAFGVVMAELCNLMPLFPGTTPEDILLRQTLLLKVPLREMTGSTRNLPTTRARHVSRSRRHGIRAEDLLRFDIHSFLGQTIAACLNSDPLRRPTAQQVHLLISKSSESPRHDNGRHQSSVIHDRVLRLTRRLYQ